MLLTGCETSKNNYEASEVGEAIEWCESTEKIVEKEDNPIYNVNSSLPLLYNGEKIGVMKINWIQKIGIPDFYNTVASTAGINYSYTINLHLDLSGSLNTGDQLVLTVSPSMKDVNDNKVGKECSVGWTGFAKTAQFYDKTTETDIEVGLQPEKITESTDILVFDIKDNVGRVYDAIELDGNSLMNAEVIDTELSTDVRSVEAINGAVISVGVNEVSINNVKNNLDELIGRYYDIDYTVSYDSAPTNERDDLLFDASDSDKLKTRLTFGVVSDVDDTLSYESDESVTRQIYSDDDIKKGTYVMTNFVKIDPGYYSIYTTNRKIPVTTGSPKYVRVQFEFPEEVASRSLEEMRHFNGRFCVIQKEITDRELPKTPEE